MPGVTVWARVALPGFHCWTAAAGRRGYLAARHRHLFIITATARTSRDRQVEFHDLADLVREWWGPGAREWGGASCESIARDLAGHLAARRIDVASVDVSEDGEAGATYTPAEDHPDDV